MNDNQEEAIEVETQLVPSYSVPVQNLPPKDIMAMRERLIEKYYDGASGLVDRLNQEGKSGMDSLIVCLVDEVIKETDHLLGNELVAIQDGNLADASVISYKRAEVLEKAVKAVQAKQVFERESGVDVNSPIMAVVFKFFMEKVHLVLKKMGYPEEAQDVFFSNLGDEMNNWQKELHEEIVSHSGSGS